MASCVCSKISLGEGTRKGFSGGNPKKEIPVKKLPMCQIEYQLGLLIINFAAPKLQKEVLSPLFERKMCNYWFNK
jgi:hypothetical protein